MTVSPAAERVPRQSDVDAFGLTHPGKMRPANADQFLIVTLHKTTQVQASSLPSALSKTQTSNAQAFIFLVADGVGSGAGVLASEAALRHVMSYVTHATRLCYTVDAEEHDHFLEELKKAVTRAHDEVHQHAQVGGATSMATTLTLVAFIWPMAYLVHVGDSRCYRLREGELQRITRDQTMAQALVDAGVMPRDVADASRWKHVLSSALGAADAVPATSVYDHRWEDVMLLCTDGLTKHASDDEIRGVLTDVKSAEEICRTLLSLALDRGATDNVTAVVGRLRERTA